MQRPLPPYRVKPLKSVLVRKVIDIGAIRELALEDAVNVKSARNTMRVPKPDAPGRLKVLGRTANDLE